MAKLSSTLEKQFCADYQSGKYSGAQLVKKYSFNNTQDVYQYTTTLRKRGLIPESKLSKSIKDYYQKKKEGTYSTISSSKSTNTPVVDYRTVYFKDFTVQIHKKAMARLVVDHNNNLHILNS